MAEPHVSVIDIVRKLPIPHRNFLFDKFHRKMPDTRMIEPKIERLAEILGPRDVKPYVDLYLHQGGLLSWYAFYEASISTQVVEKGVRKAYPDIEESLRPNLEWGADPVLYHMRRRGKELILKLAALDGEREYVQNWRQKQIRYDVSYVIVLRDDPFTIEVRSPYGKVDSLYRTISSEIGLRLDEGTECAIDSRPKRNKLKQLLDARCFFAQHRHADTEVAKTSMEAQPQSDLETGKRLKTVEDEAGVTGFSRWYDFEYKHRDDFVEYCVYKVKLSNGQVRVGKDMSESAITKLQKYVVKLFEG